MKLRQLPFEGFFEDQPLSSAQELQVVEPQNDLDAGLLAWAILCRSQTVEEDSALHDYVFYYELGDHLGGGIYSMQVSCRDASGGFHDIEVGAALVASNGMGDEPQCMNFEPMWFISKSLHYVDHEEARAEYQSGAAAFGRLRFDAINNLPHRRLFGATV
jgi:hypothetical protein